MKVTRIRTWQGELQTPATVEMGEVIGRMRSETTKAMADAVARSAMTSRLAMSEGLPRYELTGLDRLPYLVFGATFKHGHIDELHTPTYLLLLTVSCPGGHRQVMELKRQVQQVPYTLLAFAGVSGVTLKVVVNVAPVGQAPKDYLDYLKDARESAFRIYSALVGCDFLTEELTLTSGCRLSYDPQLYYQPQAQPLPVVRQSADLLKPYEGTQVEEGGAVVWYPEYNERERLQLEYQTCVQKALDDEGTNMEHCVQLLADYCVKAGLGEEGCVVRTLWQSRFGRVSEDVVRKIFRNAYKKPYNGRTLSQMNEKERIMRSIENFLARRYQLRYNVVKQVVEFRKNDLTFKQWQPMGDRQLKSIVVEEMKEGGESWMNDIRTYIESEHIGNYNPIHEFLEGCGRWDGKHDYISDFARRLKTDYADWPLYFHRWFLAMVAQALNINRDHGNSMVPLLIGGQGIRKSTFCKNILPPSLREYYMDDIKMDNAEQAKIKRLLTTASVRRDAGRSDGCSSRRYPPS